MKRSLLLLGIMLAVCISVFGKSKTIKITAEPKQAAIYINNTFVGNGHAEFTHPKKNDVAIIRIECEEYKPLLTKIYGGINGQVCHSRCYKMDSIEHQQHPASSINFSLLTLILCTIR